MLPLLVPALEAFGDFLLGEVLQYGVKKVVKKTLFKGIAKNKKNLPIPVKKPISLKKSISKKNNSVSAFTKQKKSFSVPVKNGSFGNNKVSLPLKPYNKGSNSNNLNSSVSVSPDELLSYSVNSLNKIKNKFFNVSPSDLVPQGLENLQLKSPQGGSLIDVLQSNSENLTNSLTALTTVAGQNSMVLPLILSEVRNLTESISLGNVVSSNISRSLDEFVEMFRESDVLRSIARSKDLEIEYHEFNKNPLQFTTSDGEIIANVSPREIQARKNALDYHLANDEATLKFDDLGLNDYENDFDINKILELFKFSGIVEDIKKMK